MERNEIFQTERRTQTHTRTHTYTYRPSRNRPHSDNNQPRRWSRSKSESTPRRAASPHRDGRQSTNQQCVNGAVTSTQRGNQGIILKKVFGIQNIKTRETGVLQ